MNLFIFHLAFIFYYICSYKKGKTMQTVLFHEIIFGPIHSRRLGISLGVNLLPVDGKLCSFDCVYCECGYNAQGVGKSGLPSSDRVEEELKSRLQSMHEAGEKLDVITFAGNGEPTLHPEFEKIIDTTLYLRDHYYPEAKISVLSNATRIHDESVFRALNRVDNNILKLDSLRPETVVLIDNPNDPHFDVNKVVDNLKRFSGNVIIQTMFLRGWHDGKRIDNTVEEELKPWLETLQRISPRSVMVYTIDRKTPEESLEKVSREELEQIADRARALGFEVSVSA